MSFVRDGVEDTTQPATPAPEAAGSAIPASEQVALRNQGPSFFDEDNIRFEDITFPRLNLVQKVGELSNQFDPGEIVLNLARVIHTPETKDDKGTPPVSLTVVGFRPLQYAEKVAGGKLGMLLNSEDAVAKNNGTCSWKEWDASKTSAKPLRYFQTLATALILIEKPSHVDDPDQFDFPYVFKEGEAPERYFALALWGMKGTAFTNGAKAIFTQRKIGSLRRTYLAHSWTLTTKLDHKDENYYYSPKLRPAQRNSDSFQEFIKSIIGAQ